jgi:hypothetical protein
MKVVLAPKSRMVTAMSPLAPTARAPMQPRNHPDNTTCATTLVAVRVASIVAM